MLHSRIQKCGALHSKLLLKNATDDQQHYFQLQISLGSFRGLEIEFIAADGESGKDFVKRLFRSQSSQTYSHHSTEKGKLLD